MTLRCKLFGHRPAGPGWWGDVPYVEVKRAGSDNIGRLHGALYHECDRCGKNYLVGRIHLNNAVIQKALEDDGWKPPEKGT